MSWQGNGHTLAESFEMKVPLIPQTWSDESLGWMLLPERDLILSPVSEYGGSELVVIYRAAYTAWSHWTDLRTKAVFKATAAFTLQTISAQSAVQTAKRKHIICSIKILKTHKVLLFLLMDASASISPCRISWSSAATMETFLFRKSGPVRFLPETV